jgi:hypothetical protein
MVFLIRLFNKNIFCYERLGGLKLDSMRMNTPVGSVNSLMTSTLILPVRASDDDDEVSLSGLMQYKFNLDGPLFPSSQFHQHN